MMMCATATPSCENSTLRYCSNFIVQSSSCVWSSAEPITLRNACFMSSHNHASQVMELNAQNQQLRKSAQLLDVLKSDNAVLISKAAEVQDLQAQNQQLQPMAAMLDHVKAMNNGLLQLASQAQELEAQNRQLQSTAGMLDALKAANMDLQDLVMQVSGHPSARSRLWPRGRAMQTAGAAMRMTHAANGLIAWDACCTFVQACSVLHVTCGRAVEKVCPSAGSS
jgi:uncharacterized membrane protein YgaE (UPF0421/DUF939 family)